MKIRSFKSSSNHGGSLLVTVVMVGVIGLLIMSYLKLASQRVTVSARSSAWNLCVPTAEAGLEEGLAHVNALGGSVSAGDGWVLGGSGTILTKTLSLGQNYAVVRITTATPPVIESEGFVPVPSLGTTLNRKFRITTEAVSGMKGLISKEKVTIQDSAIADSYDSSSASGSTGGVYDPSKKGDKTMIGTISTFSDDMEVKDDTKIYGYVETGNSGGLKLSDPAVIGDTAFVNNSSNEGKVQSGHHTWGLSGSFPNPTVPFTSGYSSPSSGSVGGTNYNYVLSGGNYRKSGTLRLDGNRDLIVTADSNLYVTDTLDLSDNGMIYVVPGVKLNVYVKSQFYTSGNAKINATGTPDQFSYFGLNDNDQVYMSGDAVTVGTFYAPQAKFDLSGDAHWSGAGVGEELVIKGQFRFHYDVALGGADGAVWAITSWKEI